MKDVLNLSPHLAATADAEILMISQLISTLYFTRASFTVKPDGDQN